jgi:hypothetical protein
VLRVRFLRRLIVLLAVLWVIGELAAIPVANRMVAQQVSRQTHDVADVKASVGTFPVVTRFVLTGKISRAAITLLGVQRIALRFATVQFDLSGVAIDRGRLLSTRQAHITAVDRAIITATIDVAALPARAARLVAADVRVSGRTLLVGPASFRLSSDVLPCSPAVQVNGAEVVLSCTIDHVPPALLESAQS